MTNTMTDDEAFEVCRQGDTAGWGAIYKKYMQEKYFKPHCEEFDRLVMQDMWGDSIEVLYWMIRRGKFKKQQEGKDFLLPGIIGIANWKKRNLRRKKTPQPDLVPPDITEPAEPDLVSPDGDMFMLRLCVEQLEEPYRTILLLRDFPDTPEEAYQTYEKLAKKLEELGFGKWNTTKFRNYRHQGIIKMMDCYKMLHKHLIEAELKKQEEKDYAFLNFGFPTGEFWGILYNTGKKFPENKRPAQVLDYLHQTQADPEAETADRLRQYLSDLPVWMDLIEVPNNWSIPSIGHRLCVLLGILGRHFFHQKNA